jgi:FkbM family methyltransferase
MSNISTADYVHAHLSYFKELTRLVLKFRRAFRNYRTVLLRIAKKKYPFEAILKANSRSIMISSYREALYNVLLADRKKSSRDYEIEINFNEGASRIFPIGQTNHAVMTLLDSIDNGDIFGIFADREYQELVVNGKTVVDIGANIGDSVLYFLMRGAKRVIAIEPYPRNYQTASKNVEINCLSEKVNLLLAGCSGKPASIMIEANYKSSPTSQLTEFDKGIEVPLLTLEQIVAQNAVDDGAILKMDCEGHEYDIILAASDKTLQKFDQIQIEYHFGYRNLKARLEECGFNVSFTRPQIPGLAARYLKKLNKSTSKSAHEHSMSDRKQQPRSIYDCGYLGYVYAIKKS